MAVPFSFSLAVHANPAERVTAASADGLNKVDPVSVVCISCMVLWRVREGASTTAGTSAANQLIVS